jgi:hypothetical protein
MLRRPQRFKSPLLKSAGEFHRTNRIFGEKYRRPELHDRTSSSKLRALCDVRRTSTMASHALAILNAAILRLEQRDLTERFFNRPFCATAAGEVSKPGEFQ